MGEIHLPSFKTVYSYSNQDCMGLAGGQTHRSMEENGEPRIKSIQIRSTNI